MPPGIMGIMLTLEGTSIPALHFSASSMRSKQPVPPLQSCPSMMFSLGPCRRSSSEWAAASIRMSTWEAGSGGRAMGVLYQHTQGKVSHIQSERWG